MSKKMTKCHTQTLYTRENHQVFEAVETGNNECTIHCLSVLPDPNIINSEGMSPLHIATLKGDTYSVSQILKTNGVNLNLQNSYGETALFLSCLYNRRIVCRLLLAQDADPNIPNYKGQTPLHICVKNGYETMALLLTRHNANVNVADVFGNTPLSLACIDCPNISITKDLMENGVNLSLETPNMINLFLECVLHCRTRYHMNLVKLLVENGVNVNSVDVNTGKNCLHIVAMTGNSSLSTLLLILGADINVADVTGRTPLHVATEHENADVFKIFTLHLSRRSKKSDLIGIEGLQSA